MGSGIFLSVSLSHLNSSLWGAPFSYQGKKRTPPFPQIQYENFQGRALLVWREAHTHLWTNHCCSLKESEFDARRMEGGRRVDKKYILFVQHDTPPVSGGEGGAFSVSLNSPPTFSQHHSGGGFQGPCLL